MALFKRQQWWLAALMGLTLSGCSIFGDDEEPKFAELQPIQQQVHPRVLWDGDAGDGIGDYYSKLSLAIDYGKVFAADREGIVKAMDKKTGEQIWQVDLHDLYKIGVEYDRGFFGNLFAPTEPARISGGLTVSYETLFLGTENGEVVALNTNDGSLKWHTEVGNEVTAKPAVGEGKVVVHTSAGRVFALNAETGEELWRYDGSLPPLTLRGVSAPAVEAGGAIIGDSSGRAMVLIMENGQQAWSARVGMPSGASELERLSDIDATPVIRGSIVYMVAYNGDLVALDLRSGQVRWRREYSSFEDLTVTENAIYLTNDQSHVFKVTREGGNELWSSAELFGRELTAPVEFGNYVVVGDFEGYLHWFDQDSGKLVGRMDIGGDGIYAHPVVDDNVLYVQTRDGDVVAITQD
ncbi:outer membrane protein assembly factor BamB [Idiomarina tyrosinivorans]|uniref:Outer membrane protein assembly factor BamB n=1 Tax=Idiomarina tyrosinivorans TaxID=1445662 RepID=A0A432ZR46_9GAMM|nr:outer membrane protein assembly factor BamB [Idiomarina tyrosinivorans]RUO80306.1 outer membrane protein assembly factor BamB [Idiomarina tyrosinivorans]